MKKYFGIILCTLTTGIVVSAHSNCYQDCATFSCQNLVECYNGYPKSCSDEKVCPGGSAGSCCSCIKDCDAKTFYYDPEEHARELERRQKFTHSQKMDD